MFSCSDKSPEFVSRITFEWMADAGIGTSLNDPGKRWRNGTDESF
jgi:hypothetical protein